MMRSQTKLWISVGKGDGNKASQVADCKVRKLSKFLLLSVKIMLRQQHHVSCKMNSRLTYLTRKYLLINPVNIEL